MLAAALLLLAACDARPPDAAAGGADFQAPSLSAVRLTSEPAGYAATVRRTSHGIPHVLANDYASLGYGYGHAFAQDNLCEPQPLPRELAECLRQRILQWEFSDVGLSSDVEIFVNFALGP